MLVQPVTRLGYGGIGIMPVDGLLRVLFVCIGNAYRSQMAEAFARTLGRDVLLAESAGLSPILELPEGTLRVMAEKAVDVSAQAPKSVLDLDLKNYDLVLNMSGLPIPHLPAAKSRVWKVRDPVGQPDAALREVRDEIENLVMRLVLEIRQTRIQQPPVQQAPVRRERTRLNPKLRGV